MFYLILSLALNPGLARISEDATQMVASVRDWRGRDFFPDLSFLYERFSYEKKKGAGTVSYFGNG